MKWISRVNASFICDGIILWLRRSDRLLLNTSVKKTRLRNKSTNRQFTSQNGQLETNVYCCNAVYPVIETTQNNWKGGGHC